MGRLQATLKTEGPEAYGGIFLEYEPEYHIVLLAVDGGGEEVARAVDELGYADLSPFGGRPSSTSVTQGADTRRSGSSDPPRSTL